MVNELYRLAAAAHEIALKNRGSIGIIAVRPSHQGKSHTALSLQKLPAAYILWSASPSDQKRWFRERTNIRLLMIDDPSSWPIVLDFQSALVFAKNILGGVVQGVRATLFDQNVPVPLGHPCSVVMFMNEEQLSEKYSLMLKTGLLARSVIIFSKHTPEVYRKIKKQYKQYGFSVGQPPVFQNTQLIGRTLEKAEEIWLEDEFPEMTSLSEIFSVLPSDTASDMKRFLLSGKHKNYEDEDIELIGEQP